MIKAIVAWNLFVVGVCLAGVPQEINHQGVVSVEGQRFDGDGLFRFAIVDTDTGINLWTNDGSIVGASGGIPTLAMSLTVTGGVYSIRLGDATVMNTDGVTPMPQIAPSIFNADNTVLRIWFGDGVNPVEQLLPDHKLTASPYAHVAATGVPVGTIVAYAGSSIPSGWLLCDGSAVSQVTFSDLHAALGMAWGQGDVATTFNLPDLRGRFLRGVDHGAGNDPDIADRAISNTGGNAGDNVGSLQQDNLGMHQHQAEADGGNLHARLMWVGSLQWLGVGTPAWDANSALGGAVGPVTASPSLGNGISIGGVTGTASGPLGQADTRPVNCYVNYIIKH